MVNRVSLFKDKKKLPEIFLRTQILIFLTIDVIPHRMHPARSEQQRHELSRDILRKKIVKIQNLKFSQFFVVVIVGSSGKHFCLRFVCCWINNTNYERFLLSFSEEEEKNSFSFYDTRWCLSCKAGFTEGIS